MNVSVIAHIESCWATGTSANNRSIWRTFDGGLVSDLEGCITTVLSRTSIEQKVAAFNQIAFEEGIDPVGPDDFDLDFWIRDSFIDPSLVELIRQHKCRSNDASTSRSRGKWRGSGGSGRGF